MDIDVLVLEQTGVASCDADNPVTHPYLLTAHLNPPEFMSMAFVGLFGGTETVRVACRTEADVATVKQYLGLDGHPRLRSLKVCKR
jgi:hypothetical protein